MKASSKVLACSFLALCSNSALGIFNFDSSNLTLDENKASDLAMNVGNSLNNKQKLDIVKLADSLFSVSKYKNLSYWVKGYDNDKEIPKWLQRTEIDLNWDSLGRKRGGSILTVQPLWEMGSGVWFGQGSAGLQHRFGESLWRTTVNLGIGYRHLFYDDKVLAGVNAFYDFEMPRGHRRASFGFDLRTTVAEFNGNYYIPRSKVVYIENNITERTVEGWDTEIGVSLPYMPWTKIYAKAYHWKGYSGANTHGHTFSVKATPIKYLQFELGRSHDNNNQGTGFFKLALSYNFAEANQDPANWFSKHAYSLDSMAERKLDKVRRENTIIVERVSGSSLTVQIVRAG